MVVHRCIKDSKECAREKRWKGDEKMLTLQYSWQAVCVCVCVCARARACACSCE
jgi:hypothetical protein